MQKKVLWSSLVILVIILATLFIILMTKKVNTPVVQSCEPYLNIAAISRTGDTKSCDCLKDTIQIKQCQAKISNATTYTEALGWSNLTACNDILDTGMKEACINITKAEQEFVKQNVKASTTNKK